MAGMYGKGIIKGLKVSFDRFVDTYLDDLRWIGKRYGTDQGIAHRGSKDARGIFTVQYPEEKIPVPEEFRVVPFLVYNEDLCQSLPSAMHLDRPFNRSCHRPPNPGPGRILYRR
jgi:hypothetical protein